MNKNKITNSIETKRLILFPHTKENLALFNSDTEYEGHGYMTEALTAFLEFGGSLGLKAVLAETLKENVRSQNVLKRCGFHFLREDKNLWWKINL